MSSTPEIRDSVGLALEAPLRPAPKSAGTAVAAALRDGAAAVTGNIPAALFFLLLLVVWQVLVTVRHVSDFVLPSPLVILQTTLQYFPLLMKHTWTTTYEIGIGFIIGNAIAVAMALLIVNSRLAEKALYPLLIASQTVPKVAIAPLFIIWFGFGFTPKLLLVFLLSFFPIVVSSIAGFKSADRDVMDFARTTGASGIRMFFKIRLPQALPHIFTGLKVGAALAATAAVVAEFVASDKGLGYLLLQYNGQLDTPMVFATIVILSLIGLVVYYAVEIVERLAIPWHVSQQATAKDATL